MGGGQEGGSDLVGSGGALVTIYPSNLFVERLVQAAFCNSRTDHEPDGGCDQPATLIILLAAIGRLWWWMDIAVHVELALN